MSAYKIKYGRSQDSIKSEIKSSSLFQDLQNNTGEVSVDSETQLIRQTFGGGGPALAVSDGPAPSKKGSLNVEVSVDDRRAAEARLAAYLERRPRRCLNNLAEE